VINTVNKWGKNKITD